MKLRDRVVVGFCCLSLALVTVLFVVDLQNENVRRLAAVENVFGDDDAAGVHGRSDRSRHAGKARSAWTHVLSTLMPSRARGRLSVAVTRPGAPQPYPYAPITVADYPPVDDPYADDRFHDLVDQLSRSESLRRPGNVIDWTAIRDVVVDDTYDDGTTSNEYVVEYLERGSR